MITSCLLLSSMRKEQCFDLIQTENVSPTKCICMIVN